MKTMACCESKGVGAGELLAWLMNSEGVQPAVDDCVVAMLTLAVPKRVRRPITERNRIVQFIIAAPKDPLTKLIRDNQVGTADSDEETPLAEEGRRFGWLRACSRILMVRSDRETYGLAEGMAMSELREYLQHVDPGNKFSEVTERICHESAGRSMSELREIQKKAYEDLDNEQLKVATCRPLTREELEDLRAFSDTLSEEWLSLLRRYRGFDVPPDLGNGSDVEAGRSCCSTQCMPKPCITNRCRLALSVSAALLGGLSVWGIWHWVSSEYGSSLVDGTAAKRMLESSSTPSTDHTAMSEAETIPWYGSQFNVPLSRQALDGLRTMKSECQEALNSSGYMDGSWPIMNRVLGSYPCEAHSGQLLCGTRDANMTRTCHHFGGPWTYDAFAVRNAIGNDQDCVVRCDNETEMARHTWEEVHRRLRFFPSYRPSYSSEATVEDFQSILDDRYPLVGSCLMRGFDCADASDFCDLGTLACRIRDKVENVSRMVASLHYGVRVRDAFERMTPFKTNAEIYETEWCSYDCRQLSSLYANALKNVLEADHTEDGRL
ncbi:hypothetical protein GNI_076140 [Gregarina niphandrodes]|uniref:Uncharacterized protein n=1 Tax=Gregarina niphandrodes TaxID=110365 RepID=A0A023B6W0_GRENI|nr:hypothetical protein GNI_076140 [Gregarina niphandrodes]EZG66763.1 hypothetical protein GNI_076140 [Gregarina niphandrodes]|eukprot:XP_011130494.1 hypothetical protein GNI_076140 [Gregarina niphandrodes]